MKNENPLREVMPMIETVNKYIRELAPDSKDRLTSHYSEEVIEFSILIGKAVTTLQNYIKLNPKVVSDDPHPAAYGLMVKSTNTIMAGFELVLSGYMWESSILFRSALEVVASAWDIANHQDRFELWQQKNNFKSSASISNLKKVISPVGKLYGVLSKMYVHANPLNASPSYVVSDGQPRLQLFGYLRPGKEGIRATEVHFALFFMYICLQIIELTFYQYSSELETLEKIPGQKAFKTKISDRHQPFTDAFKVHFQTMVNDPYQYL